MVAGGQVRDMAEDPAAQNELENLLTERMCKALNLPLTDPEPLISQ